MDLTQLAHFVRVVDAGGFTRAAAQLDLTQSALSRQIGLLEADLGQRLLNRTGRGAVPTDAGLALLGHAKTLLELAGRARDELRGWNASPRGRVIVGLPPRVAHVMAAPLVHRFRERFPDAVITVAESLSIHLREWLIAGRLDLALLFDPPAAPQLEYRTLAREPLVLIAPGSGPRLPARVRLAALSNYDLVLPSAPNALRSLIDDATRSRGIRLRIVAEADSVRTVLSLVHSGAGSTVMPRTGVEAYGQGLDLQIAPVGSPIVRNALVLASPRARPQTRLMRDTATLLGDLDFSALDHAARP